MVLKCIQRKLVGTFGDYGAIYGENYAHMYFLNII